MILSQGLRLAVGTLLTGPLHERVRCAVVPPGEIFSADNPNELRGWVSSVWGDAAVVDPQHAHAVRSRGAFEWPDFVPVVLYLKLCRAAAVQAVALARFLPVELVCFGHGDDPTTLRARLVEARTPALGRALFRRLEPELAASPSVIRDGIRALCENARPQDSVATLAARCCVSRASMARALSAAGLRPQRLVVGARLVRAYPLLKRESIPAIVIARAVGLASVQTLHRQLADSARTSIAELRSNVSCADFVDRIALSIKESTSQLGD